ncbi:MAG: ribosome biogenesis GTPase Der [Planctomycetes bacterium RBG_16_43_13]|nr:MAG: ribosome biogenesis GTPase Der [Planctomycetes bacterium RBG_16_43_13]
MSISVVAIVGRQNTGKSSLFNAMAGRRLSIVDPMPGVTRDRVSTLVQYEGREFELIDTGGVGLERADDFYDAVNKQIEQGIEEAGVIIFLVDVKVGMASLDEEIANKLRGKKKNVILAANKADNEKIAYGKGDFFALGFGEPLAISALHRRGVSELMDKVVVLLPPVSKEESQSKAQSLSIAIVGKRNVGKSTFINVLAGEERVIVSEKPGTTRDSIDVTIERDGKCYIVIDTAGVRKRTKVEDSVELFSRFRTERAINRADVVIFMMDVTEKVTEVDKKIAKFIEDSRKPCIIALNKWDLVGKRETSEFVNYINKAMSGLSYSPITIMSAKNAMNVWDILSLSNELEAQASMTIQTSRLNSVLEEIKAKRSPPAKGTRLPKIFYATQVGAKPLRFLLFVNDPELISEDYRRFIENKLREKLPFGEVPIELRLRKRSRVVLDRK